MAYFRRKQFSKFEGEKIHNVDYKDIYALKAYLTETAKIVPSRITGMNARGQRALSKAIKYARFLALLPYCDHHK